MRCPTLASAPGDVGRVMGAIMKAHKGEVDGGLAKKLAAELLGAAAGQTVIVSPSSCGGALAFKKAAGLAVDDDSVRVAETSTLHYAVRLTEPGRIRVFLKLKAGNLLAALPGRETDAILEMISDVYPSMEPAKSVLQTSLQNANPIIHPAVTLANAARIEGTGGNFLFYEEGVSDATGRLIEALDQIDLDFVYNPDKGFSEIFLDGEKVEGFIRSLEVSNQVSQVARIPEVRKKLVLLQQNMTGDKGIVMDGRDIGTVVFPNADLKIFLTASPETRAKRRYKEMVDEGRDITYESVLENVTQRDLMDTTRKDSPLVKADDALEIDNSHMNVKQTFDVALELFDELTE